VYAKDIRRVADFYRRTLSLVTIEEADLVVVGSADVEVAVVEIPEPLARTIQVSRPPAVRERTPIKCSFLVDDLVRVHAEAIACGGGTEPLATAWRWRGQLHLDGYDPEGNVVQFRTRDA
jgi:hypothetical protein